jgi:hypothetical protein
MLSKVIIIPYIPHRHSRLKAETLKFSIQSMYIQRYFISLEIRASPLSIETYSLKCNNTCYRLEELYMTLSLTTQLQSKMILISSHNTLVNCNQL